MMLKKHQSLVSEELVEPVVPAEQESVEEPVETQSEEPVRPGGLAEPLELTKEEPEKLVREVEPALEPVATELTSKEEPDKLIEAESDELAVNLMEEPQDATQNEKEESSEVTEQEAIATSPAQ